MEKITEKIIMFAPILLLTIIVIGFFIAEWTGAFPESQMRSIMTFGQDKRIKLLG